MTAVVPDKLLESRVAAALGRRHERTIEGGFFPSEMTFLQQDIPNGTETEAQKSQLQM